MFNLTLFFIEGVLVLFSSPNNSYRLYFIKLTSLVGFYNSMFCRKMGKWRLNENPPLTDSNHSELVLHIKYYIKAYLLVDNAPCNMEL